MIEDYLRVGYHTEMKTYADQEGGTAVVWFPAPPGALHYERATPFRSRNWLDKEERPNAGLGEQRPDDACYYPVPYLGRPRVRYEGKHACGGGDADDTERRFRDGGRLGVDAPVTLNPHGEATCCKVEGFLIFGEGGSVQGGPAQLRRGEGIMGQGGSVQGNVIPPYYRYYAFYCDGWHFLDDQAPGAAVQQRWREYPSGRGTYFLQSPVANHEGDLWRLFYLRHVPPLPTFEALANVDAVDSSTVIAWDGQTPRTFYGSTELGDFRQSCLEVVIYPVNIVGQGGSVQGRPAAVPSAAAIAGQGGSVQGGEATLYRGWSITGQGGQLQGGEAALTAGAVITGQGGSVQGGEAALTVGSGIVGLGGSVEGGEAIIGTGPRVRSMWRSPYTTTTSRTVTVPTSSVGDLILVAGLKDSIATDWTDPAGWTRLAAGNSGSSLRYGVWYRVKVAGDPTTVSWTWGGVSLLNAFLATAYTNAGIPYAVTAATGTGTTASAAGVSEPTTDVSALVALLFASGTSETVTNPSGMTPIHQTE